MLRFNCKTRLGVSQRDLELTMKASTIGIVAALVLVGGCLYTHRRVIKALVNNEPMPPAPKWHVWVKPENRRK